MLPAITKLAELESAINAGELERAGELLELIKPLLVSRNTEELLLFKTRIDQLTIAAQAQRDRHGSQLRRVVKNRGSVACYEKIQNQPT